MPLATFDDLSTWTPTIKTLHQAAKVIGRVQATLLPPRKNWQHLPLPPYPNGLRSQKLPDGGRFELNYAEGSVTYRDAHGKSATFQLGDHTQLSLLKAIQAEILLPEVKGAENISQDTPLNQIDPAVSAQYAEVQYTAFTGIARFRARLGGMFSQVAVFPHHMDISTLIFHESNTDMDEGKAHVNFGFAPFTDGQYERPYLYAYAHPYPEGFVSPALLAPLTWNLEGWTGIVVPVAEIAQHADPALFIEELCSQMYEVLMPVLG